MNIMSNLGHFSPRAYLVWDVADAWTLKGGVTTGYKAPRMGQLHKGISGVSGQGKQIYLVTLT